MFIRMRLPLRFVLLPSPPTSRSTMTPWRPALGFGFAFAGSARANPATAAIGTIDNQRRKNTRRFILLTPACDGQQGLAPRYSTMPALVGQPARHNLGSQAPCSNSWL